MDDFEGLAPTMAALGDSASSATFSLKEPATRYRPLAQLGRGGMGEVSLWRDERVGRDLAVKVALPTLGDDGRRRFVREALLQARLEHPAFVPVHDIATDERGEVYFTMRRIKGRTLRAILRDGDLSRHRLLAAFGQLCLAVDYAHSRGVVHRDIKPDNVMLGDFGEVYLLDWGIAKIAEERESDRAPLDIEANAEATRHGTVLGTLGYMPPEQLRGEHATLDGRADVYALGAVLFEILAGEPLHRGATLSELIASTLDGTTECRPSIRGADVAPELDEICARATALDREARFATARMLGDAVERFLEGDRDLALRRARAEEHSQRARELLDSAGEDYERRIEAGREAVRAIAFDPDHQAARGMLARTLGEPIQRAPRAVVEELDIEQDRRVVEQGRLGAPALFAIQVVLLLLMVWLGVREPVTLTLWAVTAFASSAVLLVAAFSSREKRLWIGLVSFVLLCISNGLTARWASPWISIPMVALANVLVMVPPFGARTRWLAFALSMAVVLVPQGLESLGLISPTFDVTDDGVTITSRMAGMPPVWFLVVHFLMISAATTLGTFQLADRARAADVSARSHAWLLRRVLSTS